MIHDIDLTLTICGWPEPHTAQVEASDYWSHKCPEHEWEILSVEVKGVDITKLISPDQEQEIINYLAVAEESRGEDDRNGGAV